MYGIRRHNSILCRIAQGYQFRERERIRNPVMIESPNEIDNLLQKCMVAFNLYELSVIEFTKEQEAEFIIKKLSGV